MTMTPSPPKPVRVQRSRRKGSKLTSPNGLPIRCVGRGTKFGNPFTRDGCISAGYTGTDAQIKARCVEAFKAWLGPHWRNNWDGQQSEKARKAILDGLPELRGKNLACWCKVGESCHADYLLEIANGEGNQP